jgi:hypothetical protein
MRARSGSWTLFAMAVAVGAAMIGMQAVNATAHVAINQTLHGTVHAPRARGLARLHLKAGSSGTFSVKAKRLAADKTFDVVVNKIKIGTLTTNAGGSGMAKFSTSPKGHIALLGVDPQGGDVEVRDDQGDDDLDGQMPDENPDSAIGCCVGDDDGETECEDLTAADCTSQGGSPTTATSCLPNPCVTTPPPNTVCCLAHSATGAFVDDDPEVECEDDVSAAECAAQGGTMVQATSCDQNPCQPSPPPNLVTCCVPQGDQGEQQGQPQTEPGECEHITADECAAAGGTVSSATSCDVDPCGGGGGGGGSGDGGGGGGD